VSPSGNRAIFTFSPPISFGSSDEITVSFVVRAGTSVASLALASLGGESVLGMLAMLAFAFAVAASRRGRSATALLVLGCVLAVAQTGCSGDDDDGGSGSGIGVDGDRLGLRVVAAQAAEPSGRVVAISGTPVDLGSIGAP
jgi:hypothetical protein